MMKKVVCLIVVFALTTPLLAQSVDFQVTDDGCGKVKIGYDASSVPEADRPVGMALKITVVKGMINALKSYDNAEFPVYIDYAYSAEQGDPCSYEIGDGHPLAASEDDPCALDLDDLPLAQVIVCMARLDPCAAGPNPGPAVVDNLVTLELVGDPGDPCTNAYVTVSAEAINRGGVVGGGDAFSTSLPVADVKIVLPQIPACWLTGTGGDTQCRGDFGSPAGPPDGLSNAADFQILKNSYLKDYCETGYNPCADANRNGQVNAADFQKLKNNYLPVADPVPTDCAIGPYCQWPPDPTNCTIVW